MTSQYTALDDNWLKVIQCLVSGQGRDELFPTVEGNCFHCNKIRQVRTYDLRQLPCLICDECLPGVFQFAIWTTPQVGGQRHPDWTFHEPGSTPTPRGVRV